MIKDAVHILGVQTQNKRYHLLEFRHSCPYGFSLSLLFLPCVSLSFFHSFSLFLLGTEWSSSSISESFNEVDKRTLESIKTR